MHHIDKLQGRFIDLEVLNDSHEEALLPLKKNQISYVPNTSIYI
jgi:hypothetical protein